MTEMNGPLWTIRFELLAYLAAGLLAVTGLFRNRWGLLALFVAAALISDLEAVWPYSGIGEGTVFSATRFGGAFMTGAVMFAWRDRIPLAPGWAIMLIIVAVLLHGTPSAMIAGQIAMAYATLLAGFWQIPGRAGKLIREVGDISYGIYILHWPIGQMSLALFPAAGAGFLFAIMLPAALAAGWVLRVFVEKPALAMKPAIVRMLRGRRIIPAE